MIQLSYLYMTTGKTIALTKWTFDGKVMSLLFNMLSTLNIPVADRFLQDDRLLGLHSECPVSLDLQLGCISFAMPTPRGLCSCSAVHGEGVEK